MDSNIADICRSIFELSWMFGNHGFNGECCGDLSLAEFMALKKIQENRDISVQEIGNAINFTKSGASKIIDRLVNKGYAVRMNSPVDGRVCCVSTTEKGKETVARVIENYTMYLNNVLKGKDAQSVSRIKETLKSLIDALQKSRPINYFNPDE